MASVFWDMLVVSRCLVHTQTTVCLLALSIGSFSAFPSNAFHLDLHMAAVTMQVFLSEQVLYQPDQLRSHQQHGDYEGPLADSGFTGHPYCRFTSILSS